MGALSTSDCCWSAEDDLLLKNSVEAGASLESLARGAVQFSRKFTLQELEDRWHSLLYNPSISSESSLRMMELIYSDYAPTSKSSNIDNSKDNDAISGKSRFLSVRERYYSLRKRKRAEQLESFGLNFLASPVSDTPFPDFKASGDATHNLDSPKHVLCGGFNGICEDASLAQENIDSLVSHNFSFEELDQFREVCDLLEAEEETKYPGAADQTLVDSISEFPEFVGGQVSNLPVTRCDAQIFNNDHLSPVAEVPDWSVVKAVASPTLPDIQVGVSDETNFIEPDAAKPENLASCDEMKNSASDTDHYLAELSSSLFEFTNEEELLLMDSDGNTINKSFIDGLSSLLMESPYSNPNVTTPLEGFAASDDAIKKLSTHVEDSAGGHLSCISEVMLQPQELVMASKSSFGVCTLNTEATEVPDNDDVFLLTRSSPSSLPFVMQCESFEPPQTTSLSVRESLITQKIADRNSKKLKKHKMKTRLNSPVIKSQKKEKNLKFPHVADRLNQNMPTSERKNLLVLSSNTYSSMPSVLMNLNAQSEVSILPVNSNISPAVSMQTSLTHSEVPVVANSVNTSNIIPLPLSAKEESTDIRPTVIKQDDTCCGGLGKTDLAIPNQVVRHSESIQHQDAFCAESGAIGNAICNPGSRHSQTDLSMEVPAENDEDIPSFSDVEAMILEEDLTPENQDLISSRFAFVHDHEDTWKTFIRLEQAADAYMRREMTSEGAFAILYGHNLKYFIRKPEVLLGRATEDLIVDIDLGREGRNSRVSRRQAIIRLDKDGSFHIKNLGRYSIFVNSKEIASKHSTSLASGCLIEVRGMPFIFEKNHKLIQQYVDGIVEPAAGC